MAVQLVAWGRGTHGQLGLEGEDGREMPITSSGPQVGLRCVGSGGTANDAQRVVLVACGANFTLLLTARGEVWSGAQRRRRTSMDTKGPEADAQSAAASGAQRRRRTSMDTNTCKGPVDTQSAGAEGSGSTVPQRSRRLSMNTQNQ